MLLLIILLYCCNIIAKKTNDDDRPKQNNLKTNNLITPFGRQDDAHGIHGGLLKPIAVIIMLTSTKHITNQRVDL